MKVRTEEERHEICKQLEELWQGVEDLRFGQFIYNALNRKDKILTIEFLYYMEDEELLEILYDYYHNPEKGTHRKDLKNEH